MLMAITYAYPRQEIYKSKDDFRDAVDAWHSFFEEDDEKLVMSALKMHISTNKWPPSIAEIRGNMAKIMNPNLLPVENAWELVLNSLQKFDMFVDPDDIFPPLIAKAVKSCGGLGTLKELSRGIYGGYQEDAARKTFVGRYEPLYRQEFEISMHPEKLKMQLLNASNLLGVDTIKMIQAAETASAEALKTGIKNWFNKEYSIKNERKEEKI